MEQLERSGWKFRMYFGDKNLPGFLKHWMWGWQERGEIIFRFKNLVRWVTICYHFTEINWAEDSWSGCEQEEGCGSFHGPICAWLSSEQGMLVSLGEEWQQAIAFRTLDTPGGLLNIHSTFLPGLWDRSNPHFTVEETEAKLDCNVLFQDGTAVK